MKQIQGKQGSRHREVRETEASRNRDSTVGITEGQKKIISLRVAKGLCVTRDKG